MRTSLTLAAIAVAAMVHGGPATAQDKATDLVMVTGTPTGTWFPTGAAFAEFADDAFGGQPISVTPGAGSIGNIMSVGAGKADMGLSYGAFLKLAKEGNNEINPGEPLPQLRAVLALVPNVLHILKADDAPFEGLGDLATTDERVHIGTGVEGATENFALARLLAANGSSFDDVEDKGGSVSRTVTSGRNDGWQNRQFHLVSYMFTPPHQNITRLLNVRDGSLVSIDPDIQKTFVDDLGFAAVTIPAGTYPGQDGEVNAIGLPTTLFTTEDVSADVVYAIVKGVAENLERMHQVSASYEALVPEKLMDGTGIELHEGAARYYRERGWL
ncbi:MAG: TAXI family TRAP transporter solute-binding subunit [Devosia sp.]